MKKAVTTLLLLLPIVAFAYSSPGKPAGYVNDFANIIDAGTKSSIEGKLQTLDRVSGIQVSVVTVKSLGGDTIENYAVQLFQEWGIGRAKRDTGVLLLVAPNEREVKIEVGYGLEGDLTDIQSGIIIRNIIIPAFKESNYSKGISDATDAIIAIVTKSPEAANYQNSQSSGGSSDTNYAPFIFVIFIVLNFLSIVLGKSKSWWLGGVIGALIGLVIALIWGFLFVGLTWIAILTIAGLIFDFIVSKHPPSGGRGMWFGGMGGRGSGGFGGGFGGFGGGMSGGGGASGRW